MIHRSFKWLLICSVSAAALPILRAGGEWSVPPSALAQKNPLSGNSPSIVQGKRIFENRCTFCHGSKGKGDGPAATDLDPRPSDLSKPGILAQSDGVLFWKISEGKKPMPAYKTKLSEEERWHIINYVRSLANQGLEKQTVESRH
jgi:mono/diheme cytochrome c family protein